MHYCRVSYFYDDINYRLFYTTFFYRKLQLTEVDKKKAKRLIILVGIFNVALFVLLMCILYMQALLSGATNSTIVNYILAIATALVPGGLVYGARRLLKGTEPETQNVHVVKDESGEEVKEILGEIKEALVRRKK